MRAPADANIDELKKKARRRLVGAIVLALAAAVFVPMLLESDERPLGDDVSVRIPPVDEGKFVNRLNSPQPAAAGKAPANPAAGAPAKPEAPGRSDATPAKSTDDVAARVDDSAPAIATGATAATGSASGTATGAATATEPRASTDTTVAPSPQADAKPKAEPAAATETRTANVPAAAGSTATGASAAKPAHGGFVVQLAAFSDDKGASALANRLKRGGHPAFTEPVSTARGTLWRVRVGPYASRDEANAARDKLKREGQSGIVAARTS